MNTTTTFPIISTIVEQELSIQSSLSALHHCTSVSELSTASLACKRQINQLQSLIEEELIQLNQSIELDNNNTTTNNNNNSSNPVNSTTIINNNNNRLTSDLLHQQLQFHSTIVADYPQLLRQNLLISKAELESPQRIEAIRNELLDLNQRSNNSKSAAALFTTQNRQNKSKLFTDSLNRTRSILTNEINRSTASLSQLNSSTTVLQSSRTELTKYNTTLKHGSQLISTQQSRERTDKLLILIGVLFFCLVVLYIINKRLRLSTIVYSIVDLLFKLINSNSSSSNNVSQSPPPSGDRDL